MERCILSQGNAARSKREFPSYWEGFSSGKTIVCKGARPHLKNNIDATKTETLSKLFAATWPASLLRWLDILPNSEKKVALLTLHGSCAKPWRSSLFPFLLLFLVSFSRLAVSGALRLCGSTSLCWASLCWSPYSFRCSLAQKGNTEQSQVTQARRYLRECLLSGCMQISVINCC